MRKLTLFICSVMLLCFACNNQRKIGKEKQAHFIIYNHSGAEVDFGSKYHITYQDQKGIWRELPINTFFNSIGYSIPDKKETRITADLFPDVHPNNPGDYRFFFEVTINKKEYLSMSKFKLTNDKQLLSNIDRTPKPVALTN